MSVVPKETLKASINRNTADSTVKARAALNADIKKIFFSKNEKFMVLITN